MSVSSIGHAINMPRLPSSRMQGGRGPDIGDQLTTEGNVGGSDKGSAPGSRSPSLGADSMAVLLAAQSQDQPATGAPASAQAADDAGPDDPRLPSGGCVVDNSIGRIHRHGHGGGHGGGPERIVRQFPIGLINRPGGSTPEEPGEIPVGGTSPRGLLGEFMMRASPLNSYSANWVEQQYSMAALLGERAD